MKQKIVLVLMFFLLIILFFSYRALMKTAKQPDTAIEVELEEQAMDEIDDIDLQDTVGIELDEDSTLSEEVNNLIDYELKEEVPEYEIGEKSLEAEEQEEAEDEKEL